MQSINDVLFGHIQKYGMVAVESDIESVLASARESAEKRAYSLENFEEMKKALYNMRLNYLSQGSPISESPPQDTLILKSSQTVSTSEEIYPKQDSTEAITIPESPYIPKKSSLNMHRSKRSG